MAIRTQEDKTRIFLVSENPPALKSPNNNTWNSETEGASAQKMTAKGEVHSVRIDVVEERRVPVSQSWVEDVAKKSNEATAVLFSREVASKIVSIRFILVVIFLTGTVLTGTLAWFLTYDTAKKSIETISVDLQYEVQGRLSDALESRIEHAEALVRMNQAYVKKSGIVYDWNGIQWMMHLFGSQVRFNKDSSTSTLTTKDGQLWGHFFSPATLTYGLWKTVNGTTYEYDVDEEGKEIKENWSDPTLDSSLGLWYTMVNQSSPESAIWTPLYVWVDRLWSSHSRGAFSWDGKWLGVVTSDMEFGFVNILLKDIKERRESDTIVVNEHGQVIGTSLGFSIQDCVPVGSSTCTIVPAQIENVRNTIVRGINRYIKSISSGGWGTIDERTRVVTLSIHGTRYIINFSGIRRPYVTWTLVTIVPEEKFLGDIQENNRKTIITVFCIIAGLAIGILAFGIYVTRPLNKVALAMQNISRLNFDKVDLASSKNSYLREISMIESSFQAMDTALRSFGKFVPMAVVKRIVHDMSDQRKLFVEKREVTILFSDVEGFTELSESLSADVLMTILSEYLNEMSQLILESGGTVLDFIGDAIVALWNAPVDVPNHALCGVICAVKQQKAIEELNKDWMKRKLTSSPLRVRIGLNTGNVMVGNIGSENRMKYDAVGDSMNLASRLEALNKRYHSRILISEDTYELVKSKVYARHLESVAVKGRKSHTKVFEVLGCVSEQEEMSAQEQGMLLKITVGNQLHEMVSKHPQDRQLVGDCIRMYLDDNPEDVVTARLLQLFSEESYRGNVSLDEK